MAHLPRLGIENVRMKMRKFLPHGRHGRIGEEDEGRRLLSLVRLPRIQIERAELQPEVVVLQVDGSREVAGRESVLPELVVGQGELPDGRGMESVDLEHVAAFEIGLRVLLAAEILLGALVALFLNSGESITPAASARPVTRNPDISSMIQVRLLNAMA